MSEVIQLNHQAENTYEFDLEIDGLTTVEVRAWFIIIVKGMELAFPCTQDKNHFTCVIQPLPFIEKTAYKGAVRLVADDYFFEVINDLIVNVTGNLSFERDDLKNMKVKTTINGVEKETKPESHNSPNIDGDIKPVYEGKTVKTDVQRVESPSDIADRIVSDLTPKNKMGKVSKNDLIENEISDFVSSERSEREEKLRNILRNFTTSPDNTPTKTRFIKKSK